MSIRRSLVSHWTLCLSPSDEVWLWTICSLYVMNWSDELPLTWIHFLSQRCSSTCEECVKKVSLKLKGDSKHLFRTYQVPEFICYLLLQFLFNCNDNVSTHSSHTEQYFVLGRLISNTIFCFICEGRVLEVSLQSDENSRRRWQISL